MILAIFAFVLTLILVVGTHEVGHAIAAKLFNVKIQRIAIGFGKPLFTWKDKHDLEWVWALWPLGGYVYLLNSRIQPVLEKDLAWCFDKKPIWMRCVILASGALANLLIAWLALTLMFMLGYQQHRPVIQAVAPQSVAAKAGLRANDRFIALGKQKTNSWQEVGMNLLMTLGKTDVPVLVSDPTGKLRKLSLNLRLWQYKTKDSSLLTALGIKPAPFKLYTQQVKGRSFLLASYQAINKILYMLAFFLIMMKQVLTGAIPFAVLLGPIGLLTITINSFFQGVAVFLYFIASFSLAVGLMNLFPFPGLDGGSIVYALVEKLRGTPIPVAVEILLYRLAVIFSAVLLVQLLLNDLRHYLH
jgi:regulator of sigma E protease